MADTTMATGGVCHRCQGPMPSWFAVKLCDPCLTKALEERGLAGELPEAVVDGDKPCCDLSEAAPCDADDCPGSRLGDLRAGGNAGEA